MNIFENSDEFYINFPAQQHEYCDFNRFFPSLFKKFRYLHAGALESNRVLCFSVNSTDIVIYIMAMRRATTTIPPTSQIIIFAVIS